MMPLRCIIAPTLALLAAASARAELKLPAIVSDHMVLQSGVPVPIWGWASPGEQVTVAFADQTKNGQADANGKWTVSLSPLTPEKKPRVLTVKGTSTLEVKDVLVGEVWLASGQSNMELLVRQAAGFATEHLAADLPEVRMFTVTSFARYSPQTDCAGKWVVSSPKTVGAFSATAFYFGREIFEALKVPVGLINSSVGATRIEAWTSLDALKTSPRLKEIVAAFPQTPPAVVPASYAESVKLAKSTPSVLFNGKIAPLIPYAIRGAIWYQGEANTIPARAALYKDQLPLLIEDWRNRWGYDFPFAWVQLPNYAAPGRNWPLVREAMLQSLSIPKTGMAIAMGLGEEKQIHPKEKKEIGRRLSLWALSSVYGRELPSSSGPLPAGHKIRGKEIVVTFTHADGGLTGKPDALKGFVIAGNDRQWKPAEARIEGDAVIVSSPDVLTPVAVRYAWANNPEWSLGNGQGLPASPFRTDNWEDLK
jgi:sialate O-acetylesterase